MLRRRHTLLSRWLILDTASICYQQGLAFTPLVAETTGTWGPATSQVLNSSLVPLLPGNNLTQRPFLLSSFKKPACWCAAAVEGLPCSDVLMLLWRKPLPNLQLRPRWVWLRERFLTGCVVLRVL